MKKYFSIIGLCLLTVTANAQWLTDMSCEKQSKNIANKAITHLLNVESPIAVGMANAALMVDETCGTAQLVIVNAALANEFGDRDEKLKKLDTSNFTDQEKAWYQILSAPDASRDALQIDMANKYPEVPLFAFGAAVVDQDGKDGLAAYVKQFPEYASPAYNVMSYRYADGYYGEADMDQAIETVKMAFLTHDGPNAYDSMAEHYAAMGDFQNAFKQQVKAVSYAANGSVYQQNAGVYYWHNHESALTDTITALTKRRVHYQMKNDIENLKKFFSKKAGMIACNSNMEPCEHLLSMEEEEAIPVTWIRWDVKNLKVYYSPDMQVAVTTFDNDGEYTLEDSDDPIAYRTRASEVWIKDNGWKLMHSNFAPLALGSGIPKSR